MILSVSFAYGEERSSGSPAIVNKSRSYPGGVDEEDLKVQVDMPTPIAGVDRRAIEERVLKSYTKKAEEKTEVNKKSK